MGQNTTGIWEQDLWQVKVRVSRAEKRNEIQGSFENATTKNWGFLNIMHLKLKFRGFSRSYHCHGNLQSRKKNPENWHKEPKVHLFSAQKCIAIVLVMLFNIIKNAGVYCPGEKTCGFQNPVYFHYIILYLSYSLQHLALLKYKFMIFWWHTTDNFDLLPKANSIYIHAFINWVMHYWYECSYVLLRLGFSAKKYFIMEHGCRVSLTGQQCSQVMLNTPKKFQLHCRS